MIERIKKNIDEYINGLVEEEKFSGAVLVSIKGEQVISKGYGMANFELDVPNTSKTKFRIGSVTKQFTAVAIMQLLEKGILNLEDTLDKYILDYPNGDKVTIHHLLTHSSGIYNHTNADDFMEVMRKKLSLEKLIDEFKNVPYDFEPGTKFSYSNSGYILLGYIIEKVSKMSYEDYLQENIFNELEMNDSGYDDHNKIIKNRASGYFFEEEKEKVLNCDFIDMRVPHAAGALYSTVEDLYVWNKGLFEGKIISKESLNKITSKQIHSEGNNHYGYGLFLSEEEVGEKVRNIVYHGGGIPGFFSTNQVFLEDDVQIIMITNIVNQDFFANIIPKVRTKVFEEI